MTPFEIASKILDSILEDGMLTESFSKAASLIAEKLQEQYDLGKASLPPKNNWKPKLSKCWSEGECLNCPGRCYYEDHPD